MFLPVIVRRNAENLLAEFCERRSLSPSGEEIRFTFEMEGCAATLFGERRLSPSDPWSQRHPLARFVFSLELGQWSLHYRDSSGRWCFYLNAGPCLDLGKLLRHLAEDPLGVFQLND